MAVKVCVFSDSHGYAENMIAAVELERPSACVFLGDGERDLDELMRRYPNITFYAVRGNCDIFSELNSALCFTIEGVRIYATHGHMSNVKIESRYDTLASQAVDAGAQIALFGHTHSQHHSVNHGVTLINPGQAGRGYYPCYAVLTLENGTFQTELKSM